MHRPLPRAFYERATLDVARDLLGMHLCRRAGGQLLSGRIVEVEAYGGPEDKASHARLRKGKGKQVPTERSALMFGQVGISYVYLIYGMHHCFNAVAHAPGEGHREGQGEGTVGAVLIRALEPGPGLASCSGPARLCASLSIDRQQNGLDLCAEGAELFIADRGTPARVVVATPRIGVDYAGPDAALPYRLCDAESPSLSRRLPGKG
jgi:DNA-3-methyladenine glycosylase